LETLRAIEGMRSEAMDKAVGSRLNFLEAQAARLEVEDNLSHMRGNQVDLGHRLEKTADERQVFIEDFRRTALQDLVDTLAKRNAAAEDLKKAELRQHMVVLTTPVDAVVLEIARRSIGSVVREAETLFSLVPRDAPLQAEVNVDSKDIGEVAVGQPVRLKFEAFPFQKYGTVTAEMKVGSRRVISYFLYPLLRGLDESIREP
jgi:hemolysin D